MANIQETIQKLALGFNASAATDINATFQFSVDNEHCAVIIKNNTCTIQPGLAADATVSFITDSETFDKLISSEITGMQAFMSGKLKTSGDLMLATRLGSLFGLS